MGGEAFLEPFLSGTCTSLVKSKKFQATPTPFTLFLSDIS